MIQVAIAGSGGFVGGRLIAALRAVHPIRALGRSRPAQDLPGVQWKETDLFSSHSTLEALKGMDVAVYLVHSMMPSSRLFQGSFRDTDLLLADNFAQACRKAGVKKIVYLGGLVPEGYISAHLQSRKEVEGVLRASGVPVTVLRAGMIVGSGGSSFEILRSLVKKLPVMVLPRWTQSTTQAVYIDDVVAVIKAAIEDDSFSGKTLDLVNGEQLTYEKILQTTAKVLGLRRFMLRVPIASTGFSKLWVQIFGNSSRELVSPLIDSLLCDLPQMKPPDEVAPLIRYSRFEDMVTATLTVIPVSAQRPRRKLTRGDTVRSIQRLPSVAHDSRWIAAKYMEWLPTFFRTVITVRTLPQENKIGFYLTGLREPLLVLESIENDLEIERAKFHIVGGLLSRTVDTGWLEFRQIEARKYTLASIHEFVPRLPWVIYVWTQALVHRFTMFMFGRHLAATVKNAV